VLHYGARKRTPTRIKTQLTGTFVQEGEASPLCQRVQRTQLLHHRLKLGDQQIRQFLDGQ